MITRRRKKTGAQAPKKILLVEDHPMMREGLRGTIDREPGLTVCGEAETAHQTMEAVKKFQPDLILTDITLPGKSGLELIKDLRAVYPDVPVLVLSMHDESLYAERVIRAGAQGYLTKQQSPRELIRAIRQVIAGHLCVSQRLSEKIVKRFSGRPSVNASAPLDVLTDREFEIFHRLGAGKTQREIAREVHLSPKTVAVHSANIRGKLKLKSQPELIHFAVCMRESGIEERRSSR